jgi:hypothetical protein
MKRFGLNFAWLLLGILTLAALLITLGERDSVTDPRIDSYGPSGLAAFAELLRSNGYKVDSTASGAPRLKSGDIAVVCLEEDPNGRKLLQSETGVLSRLASYAEGGGRLLVMSFDPEFALASKQVMQTVVVRPGDKQPVSIAARYSVQELPDQVIPPEAVRAGIWKIQGQDQNFVWLTRYGKGTVLSVGDGYMATNRHIDQAQNANVLMSSIAAIAPPGAHFVFTEASYTGAEASVLEILGPGAVGMWYQCLFLFVVVVFTLGKRFGLPEETRAKQVGQRELVDAIADTYRRARSTRVACRSAYDRADQEVRKSMKLSSDAPASERDSRVPPELARDFRRVFEGTIDPVSPADAFERCQSLRRQVRAFLQRK